MNSTLRLASPMIRGPEVLELQKILQGLDYNLSADGLYGKATEAAVLQFQNDYNIEADGIVGPKTWTALRSQKVKKTQRILQEKNYSVGPTGIDGIYGKNTKAAVKKFQDDENLEVDGILGSKTWGALLQAEEEPMDGKCYQMYHGTTAEIAKSIKTGGFKRSKAEGNMLGAGVYLTRDRPKAMHYAKKDKSKPGAILTVTVNVGKVRVFEIFF